MEAPNTAALAERWRALGVEERELLRAFRSFNAWAPAFRGAVDEREARHGA
jgi:hypothetical protein